MGKARARLVGTGGHTQGHEYELAGDEVTIGRDEKCTIVLQDKRLSAVHALLGRRFGSYHISDCHSANGTHVNNRYITEETTLAHGDQIALLVGVDLAAYLHHLAAYLVPEDHGRLDPVLGELGPVVDVNVSAAYGRRLHLQQQVFRADGRDVHVHIFGPGGGGLLHDRFHLLSHPPASHIGRYPGRSTHPHLPPMFAQAAAPASGRRVGRCGKLVPAARRVLHGSGLCTTRPGRRASGQTGASASGPRAANRAAIQPVNTAVSIPRKRLPERPSSRPAAAGCVVYGQH